MLKSYNFSLNLRSGRNPILFQGLFHFSRFLSRNFSLHSPSMTSFQHLLQPDTVLYTYLRTVSCPSLPPECLCSSGALAVCLLSYSSTNNRTWHRPNPWKHCLYRQAGLWNGINLVLKVQTDHTLKIGSRYTHCASLGKGPPSSEPTLLICEV